MMFFWIAASAAEVPDGSPNGIKILLGDEVSTSSINVKPIVIDGLRKLRNPPFWLVSNFSGSFF